jgi:hypothetical protein
MNKKISIVVLLLLLSIGFAAVTTNLILNGQARIGANSDFDVYFSRVASNDDEDTIEISSDKHSLNFNTKLLDEADDRSVFYYEITNGSMEFDANVSFNININSSIDYSDYISIDFSYLDSENQTDVEITNETVINIPAGYTKQGKIIIELKKNVTEDIQISFSVSMNVAAVEGTGYVEPPICDLSEDYCDSVEPGDKVRVGNEIFYFIGGWDQKEIYIAQYNLGVGDGFETPTNRQEPTADGVTLGTIAFQNKKMTMGMDDDMNPIEVEAPVQTGYWVDDSNQLKSEYGNSYPAYVYDSNCIFKQYVDDYVASLHVMNSSPVDGGILTREVFDLMYSNLSTDKLIEIFNSNFWLGTASSYLHVGESPKSEDGRRPTANKSPVAKSGVRPIIIKYSPK